MECGFSRSCEEIQKELERSSTLSGGMSLLDYLCDQISDPIIFRSVSVNATV